MYSKQRNTWWLLLVIGVWVAACTNTEREGWRPPTFENGGLLARGRMLEGQLLQQLDGMYAWQGASLGFGPSVVMQHWRNGTSLFGAENGAYAVLQAACLDDGTLVLEGYWRHGVSASSERLRFFADNRVGAALCELQAPENMDVRFSGGSGRTPAKDAIQLERIAVHDNTKALHEDFFVIAHRGGCRAVDWCGASENSLEVIQMAKALGASGIEIDIAMTADAIPILYHDAHFNPRLVKGRFCLGKVNDLTYAQVQANCSLLYGENIPTLDEALETVIDKTDLRAVWLDIKDPAAVMPSIQSLQRAKDRAEAAGRTVGFAIGIPSQEVYERLLQTPESTIGSVNCLLELEPDDFDALGKRCGKKIWAPRWTQGALVDETCHVTSKYAPNGHVVFWTVDEPVFMDVILEQSLPDGMLTNRPGVLLHRYHSIARSRKERLNLCLGE